MSVVGGGADGAGAPRLELNVKTVRRLYGELGPRLALRGVAGAVAGSEGLAKPHAGDAGINGGRLRERRAKLGAAQKTGQKRQELSYVRLARAEVIYHLRHRWRRGDLFEFREVPPFHDVAGRS